MGHDRAARLLANGTAHLEQYFGGAFERASQRWARVQPLRPSWGRAIADGLREPVPTFADVDALRLDELFLTVACAEGNASALAHFERTFMRAVRRMISRLANSPSAQDEVLQRVRERLFVTVGERPGKIADYRGRGPLLAWLRVAALREALTLRRQARSSPDDGVGDIVEDEQVPSDVRRLDPELALLRARYGAQLRAVLCEAIESLPLEDRALLRLNHVDGLEIQDIARVYNVHRSTISRRLSAIREALAVATRRELRARLRVTSSEVESLLRMNDSALEVPLHDALATPGEDRDVRPGDSVGTVE
jgi:RNA polymerase sigma-70 factor (ECF subfamily)